MTVDDGINDLGRIAHVVPYYRDHPGIVGWVLGNEVNVSRYYRVAEFPTIASVMAATEQAAALVKRLDGSHPVFASYGDPDIDAPELRLADTRHWVEDVCPSVDAWLLNVFRGPSFGALFDQWASITTKPMALGEFGIDAWNQTLGALDERTQADWDLGLWHEVLRNQTTAGGVISGGMLVSFVDEWWKVAPAGSQELGGWTTPAFPDGISNEEWLGIVDIDRRRRLAFDVLAAAFDRSYVPPPARTRWRAVSHGSTAGPLYGFATFLRDGAVMYQALGGGGGGRGFNVAAIDPATGALLAPITNFDTWGTRGTGDAMRAMIAFIDGLPARTLVLIAVGDDAGLTWNHVEPCRLLPGTDVAAGLAALAALGATQAESICYWDSYALAAFKGDHAVAEQVGKGVEAAVEVDLP